jgi:Helix-turn-helix domain
MTPLEPLLTLDDAADILRMSRSWVERQVRLGLLKKTKLGFVVRIDPVDLRAFIDAHKQQSPVEETVTTLRLEGDVAAGEAAVQVTEKTHR